MTKTLFAEVFDPLVVVVVVIVHLNVILILSHLQTKILFAHSKFTQYRNFKIISLIEIYKNLALLELKNIIYSFDYSILVIALNNKFESVLPLTLILERSVVKKYSKKVYFSFFGLLRWKILNQTIKILLNTIWDIASFLVIKPRRARFLHIKNNPLKIFGPIKIS